MPSSPAALSRYDLDCRLIDPHVLIKSDVTSRGPPPARTRGFSESHGGKMREGEMSFEMRQLGGESIVVQKKYDGCIILVVTFMKEWGVFGRGERGEEGEQIGRNASSADEKSKGMQTAGENMQALM
ncbi:hypothetical protein NQZ68_036882 [Dissostichus eleginoides]|nr:hypothetical protein NQZ68_036882 [Dissostichus eleginoides]